MITDEQIDDVFANLPGAELGFMKNWGYRQFARMILQKHAKKVVANLDVTVKVADIDEWKGLVNVLARHEDELPEEVLSYIKESMAKDDSCN